MQEYGRAIPLKATNRSSLGKKGRAPIRSNALYRVNVETSVGLRSSCAKYQED
jgi:hypothetical protein